MLKSQKLNLIVKRGGSLEDFWCFNEEIVARAIFKSTIQGLKYVSKKSTEKRIQRLAEYTTKLQLLNPRAIMERGYSIVRHEKSKKVIRKAADLQMGDKLLIEFHKGRITARV